MPGLGQVAPEVVKFFVLFSRFEFALKRSRMLRPKGRPGDEFPSAEADWGALAKLLGKDFFDAENTRAVASEIYSEAPMRAYARKAGENPEYYVLDWKPVGRPRSVEELIDCLKRIRNNLFHGDKTNPDHHRNTSLVREGVSLLEAIKTKLASAKLCPELTHYLSHTHPYEQARQGAG